MKKNIRQIVREQVRKMISEDPAVMPKPVDVSDSILKGAVKIFKDRLGVAVPAEYSRVIRKKATESSTYIYMLDKELRNSVLRSMFTHLELNVTVRHVRNAIGSFDFDFEYAYKTIHGDAEKFYIATITYDGQNYK